MLFLFGNIPSFLCEQLFLITIYFQAIFKILPLFCCFPCGSPCKESTRKAGDLGLIPGLRRFPGEGNGSPLQYPCLENLMDRGAWQATVHGVTKIHTILSQMSLKVSSFLFILFSLFRTASVISTILSPTSVTRSIYLSLHLFLRLWMIFTIITLNYF